jgi:hypothetical protein
MKSLLFTAILSLRERSEQLLIKFAILLQIGLTHAQTFFRGVVSSRLKTLSTDYTVIILIHWPLSTPFHRSMFVWHWYQFQHSIRETRCFQTPTNKKQVMYNQRNVNRSVAGIVIFQGFGRWLVKPNFSIYKLKFVISIVHSCLGILQRLIGG